MENDPSEVDIRTVDLDSLVDIQEIKIDPNLPKEQRIEQYLRQIKNPYCFRVGNIAVRVKYSEDGVTLQQRIEQYLQGLE